MKTKQRNPPETLFHNVCVKRQTISTQHARQLPNAENFPVIVRQNQLPNRPPISQNRVDRDFIFD